MNFIKFGVEVDFSSSKPNIKKIKKRLQFLLNNGGYI
jgi:hypothetical protein